MDRDETVSKLRAVGLNLDTRPRALIDEFCGWAMDKDMPASETADALLKFEAGWQARESATRVEVAEAAAAAAVLPADVVAP